MDTNFPSSINAFPLYKDTSLTVVGYYGFRWATQIDPIWNAYLLAQVLSLGPKIEKSRVPIDDGIVYSYRLRYDEQTKHIFNRDIGWKDFQQKSVDHATKQDFSYVVLCDISEFYSHINHEKLGNILEQIAPGEETIIKKIIKILNHISIHQSYGLPIGGPASRMLSELFLDRIDRHLISQGVTFCRYADDYRLFASNKETAYEILVFLSEKLFNHAGLSLQKSKTQIVTTDEYLHTSEYAATKKPEDSNEASVRRFMSLRVHYDPYSPTAVEDWEELCKRVSEFDILEMLSLELKKSRIHMALVRRLITTVRVLEPSTQNGIINTVLENLEVLYPVLPTVFIMLKSLLINMDQEISQKVFSFIRNLIQNRSFLIRTPANLSHALRILSHDLSSPAEKLMASLFTSLSSSMIRRDIILAMANRRATYWLDDLRVRFSDLNTWEQRALAIASVTQGRDGSMWRKSIEHRLSSFDKLAIGWAEEKLKDTSWIIPL